MVQGCLESVTVENESKFDPSVAINACYAACDMPCNEHGISCCGMNVVVANNSNS